MKKLKPRWPLFIIPALILLFLIAGGHAEAAPYRGYRYDWWGYTVASPNAYLPKSFIDGNSLGVGPFNNPQDIFVTEDQTLYILDSGNARIIIFNEEWESPRVIREFMNNGKRDGFKNPCGIFVTKEGRIYVADRDNARIVELDSAGGFCREIGPPGPEAEDIIKGDFTYQPLKVVVDAAGRIYVLAHGVYDGIMEFDHLGRFRGFIGAPRITPSLTDLFWMFTATREQRERRALFLPTEFSSIRLDDKGFIYASVSEMESMEETAALRRLNPAGKNVLRTQFWPPVGDLVFPLVDSGATIEGRSVFVDVIPREHGMYSALDRRRGRVFTYDANGGLLYTFGGRGDQMGLVENPVAIGAVGEELLIVDSRMNRVLVFEPTPYAAAIHAAIGHYHRGDYEAATEKWWEVLKYNAHMDQAYVGIGRSLLMQDKYKEAMEYFRLGNFRWGYSQAFRLYRRQVINKNFSLMMTLFLLFCIAWYLVRRFRLLAGFVERWNILYGWNSEETVGGENGRRWKWRQTLRSLWYAVYAMLHPAEGFWNLKYEKRGNLSAATILLFLAGATRAINRQYAAFIVNPVDLTKLNILTEFAGIIVPFLLWVVVNWSLTTLMEGKGTIKDIYIAAAFALTPYILIILPITLLSYFLLSQEAALYYVLRFVAQLWFFVLLFTGSMMIHEFSVKKTFWSTVFTGAGMVLVAFIALLFFSLIGEMVFFVTSLYNEINFRL